MDDGGTTKKLDAASTQSTFAIFYKGLDGKPVPVPPVLHYLFCGRRLAAFGHLDFFACYSLASESLRRSL